MKLTCRSTPGIAVALMVTLQITGCAQKSAPQPSFADQVALRLAKADLLGEALTATGNVQQLLGNIAMDTVIEPLEESLDLKAARILVHGSADQNALESSARLFNEAFRNQTKNIAQLADLGTPNSHFTPSFMDRMLSDAAASKDKSNRDKNDRSWSDTVEKASLELLDSSADKAPLVKRTAEALPALRSQETLTIVEQLRAGLSQAIARHPEHLKPFSEEKPLSATIQASMAKLQKLLQTPAGGQ
jgi:hypothetical protein